MKDGDLLIGIMASLGRREYTVAELAALVRPFAVTAASLRTNLSRLQSTGVLVSRREGGKTAYAFASKGRTIIGNVAAGFGTPDWSGWDGSFWGMLWSLPAADKNGRYRIAKKLSLYRFAPLFPGCWIRPYREREGLEEKLDWIFSHPRCRPVRFHPVRPFTRADAATLWDIAGAAAAMREAIGLADAARANARGYSPEQAFVEKLVTGERMVAALFRDPLLPAAFLPADWPAPVLRRRFAAFDAAMTRLSRPFWENIVDAHARTKRRKP
jgi:phenylacetic acid degradation operon negative regulatory protein